MARLCCGKCWWLNTLVTHNKWGFLSFVWIFKYGNNFLVDSWLTVSWCRICSSKDLKHLCSVERSVGREFEIFHKTFSCAKVLSSVTNHSNPVCQNDATLMQYQHKRVVFFFFKFWQKISVSISSRLIPWIEYCIIPQGHCHWRHAMIHVSFPQALAQSSCKLFVYESHLEKILDKVNLWPF